MVISLALILILSYYYIPRPGYANDKFGYPFPSGAQ
jgi:hypothetical protein